MTEESVAQVIAGPLLEERRLARLLACSDQEAEGLFRAADEVRARHLGEAVHLRGLLEFSNHCRRRCRYCGLRADHRSLPRYRMTPEEIVEQAVFAESLGYRSLVMQSGEDPWFTAERLAEIITRIKARTDLALTLSVGERDEATYRRWREAGADRYLLRIETTDPELFAALHPDASLPARQACLYALRDLGYQLGTGVMVGLPGQTPEMLARDVLWMRELGAEMIGIGPFIPHPHTPLAEASGGTLEQALRLVAVLRLVFPHAHLPATTALGSLDPLGRERALQAGANVVMPNLTPTTYRPHYEIYPGKICLTDDAAHCRGCITGRITALGRSVACDHGHVLRPGSATAPEREAALG